MSKVLILATSHTTRGGITSVINSHKKGKQWNEYQCKWIETHSDKNLFYKIIYFIRGIFEYLFYLPFFDIIHIHTSEPASALRKCIFMLLAKSFNKKTIVHFHAFSPESTINSKYHVLYKYLFLNADRIIVLSQYWKDQVDKVFHLNDKLVVLFNACDVNTNNEIYNKKNQILFAGILNERKGYKDLIQAFARISSKMKNWTLVFAGSGEIEKAKELARTLKIEKQIRFLGWCSGDNKDKIFKESKIFCLPSYAEGFPMAILDAWAYSLPVIATPVGGLQDIVKDNDNILLFKPGDIEGLSTQILRLSNDNNFYNNIKNSSIKLAETVFNRDVINKQLKEIYDSLV